MVCYCQEHLQHCPEDECVGFDEDVPLHIRVLIRGPIQHGYGLLLVKLPSWIPKVPTRACHLHFRSAELSRIRRSSSVLLKPPVWLKLWVVGPNLRAYRVESVKNVFITIVFLVVGKEQVMRTAL